MKIGGVEVTRPAEEVLVLPRGEQSIAFRARGIADMDEFAKLCPEPKPPGKLTKEGWVPNEDDESYKAVLAAHSKQRLAFMVVRSLEPSQIEWDSVDPANPRTWTNYEADFKRAGLTQVEVNRIVQLVLEANCLDENKLKKAREVFQLGQRPAPAAFSGPSTAPASTPSGEPAPVSA